MIDAPLPCENADTFRDHFDCPSCGFDWFSSKIGHCPECGLPNGASLFAQYQRGLRPLPVECPGRPPTWRFFRTIFSLNPLARAVHDFPADVAIKTDRAVMVITAFLYVSFAFGICVLVLANRCDPMELLEKAKGLGPGGALQWPALQNYFHAALWIPMPLAFILIVWVSIRRMMKLELRRRSTLSKNDVRRLFAYTSSWLGALYISWNAANLIPALLATIVPSRMLDLLLFAAILLIGLTLWRYVVKKSLISFTDLDPQFAHRLADSLHAYAIFGGLFLYWSLGFLYVEFGRRFFGWEFLDPSY